MSLFYLFLFSWGKGGKNKIKQQACFEQDEVIHPTLRSRYIKEGYRIKVVVFFFFLLCALFVLVVFKNVYISQYIKRDSSNDC